MMKGFYRENNFKKKRLFSIASIGTFVFVTILVSAHLYDPSTFSGVARTFAYPFWSGENNVSASVSSFFLSLQSKRKLVEENRSLVETIENLRAMEFENKILREENTDLKRMWGQRNFERMILAPVLRRPSSTLYDTLIIDTRGNKEILEGKRVVADGRFVIGEISSVSGKVAVVSLFSTPGVETEVFIGTSTASVVAKGLGSGNFTVKLPRETGVVVGENITLPGVSLPFSIVESVDVRTTDPFEIIRFRIPVNINALKWVEVVTIDTEIVNHVLENSSASTSSIKSDSL